MAIVQISQITNRLGLQADLPQLAGAELGWSTDTRQLYIGNGTLEEGAPVIGNTEILTEFSDILNLAASYTYEGLAAGYAVQTGPTPGSPVVQSLQSWMDQFCTVKDFGAKGDGLTDDTAAINRALNQLYCQQTNPSTRRSLFFPAGVYIVSSTINIPTFATLVGEGADCSIIRMVAVGGTGSYVAQYADSLQQTGVNIGNNGAIPPTDINIANMSFQSLDATKNIFLTASANFCEFHNVSFTGPGTTSTLTTNTPPTIGLSFISSSSIVTTNITVNHCRFSGLVYGINTNQQTKGISVNSCIFNILYQGIVLGEGSVVNGGPTGFRIINCVFDNIYNEGIFMGGVSLNFSGSNIFYDVANNFLGSANPTGSIIVFQQSNNVSVGDMFTRDDAFAVGYPRINISDTTCIATTNGVQLQLGTKTTESGLLVSLTSATTNGTAFTLDASIAGAYKIDYSIIRGGVNRVGTLMVATAGSAGTVGTVTIADDGIENSASGITFNAIQSGNNVTVRYTTTAGVNAQMRYSISYFN